MFFHSQTLVLEYENESVTLGWVQCAGMYGYCGDSKFGLHQLATTSSTIQVEREVSSLPKVSLTILWTPSASLSPGPTSPDGSLKKVLPKNIRMKQ